MKCEVCGKKDHSVKVYGSHCGPVSLAYCYDCAKEKREPYQILVSCLECASITKYDEVGDSMKPCVDATLKFFNKSHEEFELDLQAQKHIMDTYYSNYSLSEDDMKEIEEEVSNSMDPNNMQALQDVDYVNAVTTPCEKF